MYSYSHQQAFLSSRTCLAAANAWLAALRKQKSSFFFFLRQGEEVKQKKKKTYQHTSSHSAIVQASAMDL